MSDALATALQTLAALAAAAQPVRPAVAPDGTRVAVGWTATRAAALRDAALALEAYALTEVTP